MNVAFAPLAPDAVEFLTQETGVDFLRIDFSNPRWFCVTARRDDDSLMGVATFDFKEWFNAHFSAAISDPRCLSRKLLRTMFHAVFSQARRITALVEPGHQAAIEQCRRMGFVYEGFLRLGVEGRRDALIFGMLAEDCRYLPGWHPARTSVIPVALGGFHGLQS